MMDCLTKSWKSWCLIMVLWLLVLGLGPVQGGTLMERLPADTLVCVRINGFDQTLSQLDLFLMGATPIPLSLSSMGKMQLGSMLGNTQLQGLNTQGTVAIVAVAGQRGPMMGILVPVTDFQAFTDASTSIQAGEQDEGFVMRGPGGKSFSVAEMEEFALLVPGKDHAQVSALKQQLDAGDNSLAAHLDGIQKKAADAQPIWIYINTAMVGKLAAPMVQMAVSQAQAMVGMMGALGGEQVGATPGSGSPSAVDIASTAGALGTQICQRLAQETKYAVLSLAPTKDSLTLDVQFQSVPGSAMSQSLTRTGAKRDSTLLGYLQEEAVFSISGNLMGKLMTLGCEGMSKTPMAKPEEAAKIKALVEKMGQQFRGSDALSVKLTPSQVPFVSLQYAAQVADASQLRDLVGQLTALIQANVPEEGPRVKLEREVQTHREIKVDGVQWSHPKAKGPVQAIDYRMAFVDQLFVLSLGSDVEGGIAGLIDKALNAESRATPPDVKKLLNTTFATQQADIVAAMNLARLIQQVPKPGTPPNAAMVTPSQSGMVAHLNLDNGRADFGLVLPKLHLQEVTQVLQMMMMQRMMQQQQQPPGN